MIDHDSESLTNFEQVEFDRIFSSFVANDLRAQSLTKSFTIPPTRENFNKLRACYNVSWLEGDPDTAAHLFRSLLVLPVAFVPADRNTSKLGGRKTGPPSSRLFRFVELSSRILPTSTRLQAFEPAYNDEKVAYLADRRKYKTRYQRVWLKLWFGVHVGWMIPQCFWGMLSDKVKRLVVGLLPEVFRRIMGG
jgi:hypothetical protein